MFSFLSLKKKKLSRTSKILAIFLLVFMIFSFLVIPSHPAQAQLPVTDSLNSIWNATDSIWKKVTNTLKYLWQKGGSLAFQQVLRSTLNSIAYDTANYIGSGGEGQKPLFVTQDWGAYLAQIGDEAAGSFVENFANNLATSQSFVNEDTCDADYVSCSSKCGYGGSADTCYTACTAAMNECQVNLRLNQEKYKSGDYGTSNSGALTGQVTPSFNVCAPTSLTSKVKITLGLVDQQRPQTPTCKATEIIKNWGEAKTLFHNNPNFLEDFKDIFDPRGNDLGIYWLAKTDMSSQQIEEKEVADTKLIGQRGWLDRTSISGNRESLPNQAELDTQQKSQAYSQNFGKYTGDAFIDALNVFLNQLALSAFNNLMQNLGKETSGGGSKGADLTNPEAEVRFGESDLNEVTSKLTQPDFGVRTDYDILSSLAMCPDPKNPGPTNCVIDNKLMQGITEKRTVAEAIKGGYLYGDWQLTADTQPNAYSLRNILILRKYRILPVGWEKAIRLANSDPSRIKKMTLNDLVSCFDPNDKHNTFSAEFNTRDQGWCQGLVDPNWVLKAPLNYCKKQGVSSQILNKIVIPGQKGVAGNPDVLSMVSVTRAEEYCADEQTCIKEKSDGSCSAYGYCNEEKRTWNFNKDSCEAIYNTCQTFTNAATNKSVSYLKNTLDYGNCGPESAGCRRYSLSGAYATSTGSVIWNGVSSIYLNKSVAACSSKDEGCTELIRIRPTWGVNLVMNSDFSNDNLAASSTSSRLNDWPVYSSGGNLLASIVDGSLEPGGTTGKVMRLEANGAASNQIVVGLYSDYEQSLLPANLQIIPGQSYTLSADIYLASGDHAYTILGDNADQVVATTTVKGAWQHISVTRRPGTTYNEPVFNIHGDTSGSSGATKVLFYVKNIKLEASDWDTGYSTYGASKIYEKLIPSYLEKACYVDATSASKDYRFKDEAPDICYDYARKCNRDEVGCSKYTAAKDGFEIPAKVSSTDYCPSECLDYDIYVSRQTNFNSASAENILPKTAQTCNASAVGCNEFTNLDSIGQGGEQKEYYTYLKQCIKPSQGTCASFYAWEGTEGGYQLKIYNLERTATNEPKVTSDDSALCNETIYNLPLGAPGYNPDCREFYNSAGGISYHLNSRVITCSDNCHAYRMSEKNIDQTVVTSGACSSAGGFWDNAQGICYLCLNNGNWDTTHNACIYQAIPGEGQTCAAAEKACREYNGSDGNNERLAFSDDFEAGKSGWFSNCGAGLSWSTIANTKNGHSIYYNSNAMQCASIGEEGAATSKRLRIIEEILAANTPAAQMKVDGLLSQGNAYTVRFIARAAANSAVQIYFLNKDTSDVSLFNASSTLVIKGGNEWSIYQANLGNLDHEPGNNELLVMTGTNSFYFDDFTLTEITDRYYLIKDSSLIPDICYYDIFDNYQGADYNLGCSRYIDAANVKHDLRQFSRLCADTAVGCEQMIDTKNYLPYGPGIWKDENNNQTCDPNELDCFAVGGDTAIYAVYSQDHLCNSVDAGCARLGQGQSVSTSTVWSDVFKKNQPNFYNQTLCGYSELGCEEWRGTSGELNYFRDPGSEACTYRTTQDPAVPGKAWYKIPVKRCDSDNNGKIEGAEKGGSICISEANCKNNRPCIIDTNDYPCSVTYFKTLGTGGAGNQVPVPDKQAGLCEKSSSGCTEYIDPMSQFSANIVFNPSYALVDNRREGWNGVSQEINLIPNKLYIFGTESPDGNNVGEVQLRISGAAAGVKPLLNDNTLGTSTKVLSIPTGSNRHLLFASLGNNKATIYGGAEGKTIVVREAVVDYQLIDNVDKKSCNGLSKFDNGCILFNERKISGSQGLVDLSSAWDAYATGDGQAPAACDSSVSNSCNANQLIKVRPDRVCSKWLDCLTYIQDPATNQKVCYAVGECNRLNDKNECANFLDTISTSSVRLFDAKRDKDATGYSQIDKYYFGQIKEVGPNSEAHYDFEDSIPALTCERVGGGPSCTFTKNIAADSIIREPDNAPTDYPAHGKSYLKVPANYLISPHSQSPISLIKNNTYYLNYLLNTKNSGLGAKITIKGSSERNFSNPVVLGTFTATANNGWRRLISVFNTGNTPFVRIYLGADNQNSRGYVYFDDINIEPVLQVNNSGNDEAFLAKECRLYPTVESLTCSSKNNNVISDGLEGYCLEHDPDNSEVCLLWYPVDLVGAAKNSRSPLGYTGKFPLSYCSELNGDFDLVEKRTMVNIDEDYDKQAGAFGDSGCEIIAGECNGDSNYNKVVEVHKGDSSAWKFIYCVPKKEKLKFFISERLLGSTYGHCADAGIKEYSGWGIYDGLQYWKAGNTHGCENNSCQDLDESKTADPPVRVYDYNQMPSQEDNLKFISGLDPEKNFRLTCNLFTQVVDNNGANKAWTNRISSNSIYATQTPPFFLTDNSIKYSGNPYYLSRYGRNREDVPFGAAVWPDNFDLLSSEPVKFRDQYSKKNNEEIFAGRPFGCGSGGDRGGCQNVGYCSLDPNVFCLLGRGTSTDYVSQKTCSDGAYGSCYPIWTTDKGVDLSKAYKDSLRSLFIKSYGSLRYDYENSQSYAPPILSSDGNYQDYSEPPQSPYESNCEPSKHYVSNHGSISSFCGVWPKIENVSLKFLNGQEVPKLGGTNYQVPAKGIYRLEFNTIVDPEQQPLKEIRIDWGGDDKQIITGQDHRPSLGSPHVFYHYYRSAGLKNIRLHIFDNWGEWSSCLGDPGAGICWEPIE